MDCYYRLKACVRESSRSQDARGTTVEDKTICNYILKQDLRDECAICLETMKQGESVSLIYCSHIFHTACIYEWFQKKPVCPFCEKRVSFA